MKERLLRNYKKNILGILFIFAMISVGIICTQSINKVLDAGTKTYYVQERDMESVEAEGTYEKTFLCVGKKMQQLQIEVSATKNTKGNVFYKIVDSKNETVLENTCEIEKLLTTDLEGIYIDVSDIGLIQGERYVLTMNFQKVECLEVILGDGNLSIRQYFDFSYKKQYVVAIVVCAVVVTAWFFWICKKELNSKYFFCTALFVGMLVACITPPANRDDEYRHFIKAYTEAIDDAYIEEKEADGTENGMIRAYGPVATVPYVINEIRLMDYEGNSNGYGYLQEVNLGLCLDKLIATIKAKPINTEFKVGAEATADRGREYYWPQILAMKIGGALGAGDMFLYYIARFGQVLVCAVMGAIAIWIAPKLRMMIWLLFFVPNVLLLTASCNCDGLLISEIMLLVAIVVWLKEEKISILSKQGAIGIIAYTILTYNIVVMKIPYVIICVGLLLYLGKENISQIIEFLREQKKSILTIGCITLLMTFGAVVFLNKEQILDKVYSVMPREHIDYILQNKRYICGLFTAKWVEMIKQLFVAMCGYNYIPYPIMVGGILLLMKKNQSIIKKLGFAFLFAIMVMAIVLVGYTLTPPDYGVIWGITFRYILPFVIIGALCLPIGTEATEKIGEKLVPISVYVITGTSLITWLVQWSI